MKQIRWVTFISMAVISAGLASCMSQNPYPADGILTVAPAAHHPVTPPYVLDAPESVVFREGKLATFNVVTLVPSGTAIVNVQGLPDGATYDSVKGIFSWTPDFNAGHDPSNPTVFEKDYPVDFYLSSSDDQTTVIHWTVNVRVMGVAMPLDIVTDGTPLDVQEGNTLNVAFSVKSPDFPQGPFGLQFSNLPYGVSITQSDQDPTTYNFTYTPSFDVAGYQNDQDANGFIKKVHVTAVATGPRAQKIQKAWDLVVHDVRQQPTISAPDKLTFSYAADFSFHTEDLNGEEAPSVTIDKPAFGVVNVDGNGAPACSSFSANGKQNPYEVCEISWTGIPAAQFNIPQSLTVHSCGIADIHGVQLCTTQVVNMTFVGKQHNAPTFDRTNWGPGDVKYIRLGTTLSVPMTVTDADAGVSAAPPAVTVGPVAMQSEVTYANGVLTLVPVSVGTRVFQLVSDSVFQVEARESFTMRVLPKDWGSVVLLGQSKTDPEVQATLPILGDGELINPFTETVDDDTLVFRKSAFMTTSSINSGLSPGDLGALLGRTENVLGHVVVSSPLTAKLPRPALPDDLTLAGRFSQLSLPGKPSLNVMSVTPVLGSTVFVASKKPVKLNQSLTAESADPMTFTVKAGGACSVVMNLVKDTLQIPVAVECTLSSGNKVLFVGFEWGDMAFDATDAGLGQTWLTSWLATTPTKRSAR